MADDEALLTLLQSAVFRIDIGDVVSGTGFAVAPGQIITCYHVIEPALKNPKGLGLGMVRIFHPPAWEESQTPLADFSVNRELDLALLRIPSTGGTNAALLGENIQTDDPLYTYGFTAEKPQGTPVTFSVEGVQGGKPPLAKVKEGQVQPGMSGAPALNRRTGSVCGVMRRSRGVGTSLGGFATPMDVVLGAFKELRKDNRSAPSRARWLATMSPEQQTAHDQLNVGRGVGPGLDVVVRVRQDDDGWLISTTLPQQGEQWGNDVRVDLNALRTDVARLFRLLKATGRLKPIEQSRVFGQTLAKAIWSEEMQTRLRTRLYEVNTRLHVSMVFDEAVDEDLQFLPWEQLTLPKDSTPPFIRLAAEPNVTFSRVVEPDPAVEASLSDGALRVALVSSPGEEAHEKSTTRLTNDIAALIALVTDRPQRLPSKDSSTTPLALDRMLGGDRLDVLHYVGFGRYEGEEDQIQLDGSPDERVSWLNADELAEILAPQPPRLVVLQPFKVSESQVPVDFTALAVPLLRVGVDAVLAFPLPVDREAAITFFSAFYEHLGEGDSLRSSVQEGRVVLERLRAPWAFPALLSCRPVDLFLSSGKPILGSGPTNLAYARGK